MKFDQGIISVLPMKYLRLPALKSLDSVGLGAI